MSISKKINYKSIINDKTLDFLKNRDDLIIEELEGEDGIINGVITISSLKPGEKISRNDSSTQFFYNNFTARTHYETKREIYKEENKSVNLDEAYKAIFNLEYNFLIKKYEQYLSANKIPEVNLPNFYDTVNVELITTPMTPFDGITFFETDLESKYRSTPIQEQQKKIVYDSRLPYNLWKITKIRYFSDYLKKYNGFKEQFPFYTEIIFDNEPLPLAEQYFSKILDDLKVYREAITYHTDNITGSDYQVTQKDTTGRIAVKTSNLDNYFSKILTEEFSDAQYNKILEKINSVVNRPGNELNYRNILNGDESYQEIVGYKVSKFDIMSGSNPVPLQEWYIPISKENNTEFIDTQVLYDKQYKYNLSLLAITIASKYEYVEVGNNTVKYKIAPTVSMLEIPSTEYDNYILDYPPIEPEVEMIPYVGISDKIKININTSIGKKDVVPVTFTSNEAKELVKISKAQDKTDNKIIFQSDEPNTKFEVYMLDYPPNSYSDFLKAKKQTIATNSSAGAVEVTLLQNTIYYFTFRGFDYHGHFSNPTAIYTAELLNDNGVIYPIFGVYEKDSNSMKQFYKRFRRFMSVEPSIGSTVYEPKNNNFDQMNDKKAILDAIKVGANYPGMWGKNIKLRVTSLSSGKKIDINVQFDINKEK